MTRLLVHRVLLPMLTLVALISGAHADLKVVSKTTADAPPINGFSPGGGTGAPKVKPGEAVVVTTYYKGSKVRVEEATGAVTITDNEAGTITRLDPKKKTYSTTKLTDLQKQLTESMGPAAVFLEQMELKVKSNVKKGGHEREIAGKKTTDYLWTATMSMSMKGSDGSGGVPAGELANIAMEGEQWTSEEVQLPTTQTKAALPELPGMGGGMMAGMMKMMASMPGMKTLMETFAQIKGFSLLTNMKILIKSPFAEAQGADVSKPITNKTEVIELSDAELPTSLFIVPEGLKKVPYELPQRPGFGG